MKLAILLFALVLSVQGWCASVIPVHQTMRNKHPQEEIKRSLQEDKIKSAMIGCILITYLTAVIWWVMATKRSLDNVLKEVLQNMARYNY